MLSLKLLTAALDTASRTLAQMAGVQGRARSRLVSDLQSICSKCEDGYIALLEAMKPVRKVLRDEKKLPDALDTFAADATLARRFKPSQLCGEVDQLLVDLRNWLSPLRYAWGVDELDGLRENLRQIDNLDQALSHAFFKYIGKLTSVSRDLRAAKTKRGAAVAHQYAEFLVTRFVEDLRVAVQEVQEAKRRVIVGRVDKALAKQPLTNSP